MCGIAGFALNAKARNKFPVETFARELLLGIESRGKHATGYISMYPQGKDNKPKVAFHKSDVAATDFVKLHSVDRRAQIALLHTRHWTKGDPKISENNHPVLFGSCFAVHNGSIDNDDDVIKEAGIEADKRVGTVDSWAVPVALEYHGWAEAADIKSSLHMLKGAFAIAAVDPIKRPGVVLLAKGEMSPLHILTTAQGIFWASEEKALKEAWAKALGTPPKNRAAAPDEIGWRSLREGQYWLVDVGTGRMSVKEGSFEVNPRYTQYHGMGNSQAWRPYTHKSRDWTCWPDTKNCVFGDDCGNCDNNKCICWDTNVTHPKLNEDLSWKKLHSEFAPFRTHVGKYKLTEESVSRPQKRELVVVGNPTPAVPAPSTVKRETGQSKNILPFVPPKGSVGGAMTRCLFCEKPHKLSEMKALTTVMEGIDALYECEDCRKLGEKSGANNPTGHDPKLRPALIKAVSDAMEADAIIDAATQTTAWEFRIPPRVVRYMCLYRPNPRREDNPDYYDFVRSVKDAFTGNLIVVQELRDLESAGND